MEETQMIASCFHNQLNLSCQFVDLTSLAWCGAVFTVALIGLYFMYKTLNGSWK